VTKDLKKQTPCLEWRVPLKLAKIAEGSTKICEKSGRFHDFVESKLFGRAKQARVMNEILRVLAEEVSLGMRQVHIRISKAVKGYPERIPSSTFYECVDSLMEKGFIKKEPVTKEREVIINLRLTILGYSYVIYQMFCGEWRGMYAANEEKVFANFYAFLTMLYKKLLAGLDGKRILERAGEYVKFRPVEKLFFLLAEKTLKLSSSKPPAFAKVVMEHISIKTMKGYLENIYLTGREPESKHFYKWFLEAVDEAVGEYLLSDKNEDFDLSVKTLKEALAELSDLEKKMLYGYIKSKVELKLYSAVPALPDDARSELKTKIIEAGSDDVVLPYYCPKCESYGFTTAKFDEFLTHLSVKCEKCKGNTNHLTFGKLKIAELIE